MRFRLRRRALIGAAAALLAPVVMGIGAPVLHPTVVRADCTDNPCDPIPINLPQPVESAISTVEQALPDINRPGPVPPCDAYPPPLPPTAAPPTPAQPGDQGDLGAGTITTVADGTAPGVGCNPESFSLSTTEGSGQIQIVNDPVTYVGELGFLISGSSQRQSSHIATGSATVTVHGSNPYTKPPALGPVAPSAPVDYPTAIDCSLSGSYLRQDGTLTVTATGPCQMTFTHATTGDQYTIYGHWATLVISGSTAPAAVYANGMGSVTNAFTGEFIESAFGA